jgi:hypothetical protein
MTFLSTTTGRIVLIVCFLWLLRLAFLPVGVIHSPPADGTVQGGLITVPAHGYVSNPVAVREQKYSVPMICVLMQSPLGPAPEIHVRIFDHMDLPGWAHGEWSGAIYDAKMPGARQIAIPVRPSRGGTSPDRFYYVVLGNEGAIDKTFLAAVWLDQVPQGMLFYQQGIWLLRFLLFLVGILMIVASRKPAPRTAGEIYAVPPAPR